MQLRFTFRSFAAYSFAAACLLFTPAALADEDVLIARDPANKLVTGNLDDGTFTGVVGNRVFEFEVTAQNPGEEDPFRPGAYLGLQEPGFGAVAQASLSPPPYLALPAGQQLRFRLLPHTIAGLSSNLFYWNGLDSPLDADMDVDIDDVLFTPVAPGHRLTLKLGGLTATATGDNSTVTGFLLDTTTASGGVHRHVDTFLDLLNGAPPAGIYLLPMQFTMTGLADSDPTFLVYNADSTEAAHGAAVDWANANLLAVPEPSTWVLAASGAVCGLLAWRRRFDKRRAHG